MLCWRVRYHCTAHPGFLCQDQAFKLDPRINTAREQDKIAKEQHQEKKLHEAAAEAAVESVHEVQPCPMPSYRGPSFILAV